MSIQPVKKVPRVYIYIYVYWNFSKVFCWKLWITYYTQQRQCQRKAAEHPSTSEAWLEAEHQTQHHSQP